MTTPQINTELFRKVYDQISQHPETHNQSFWYLLGWDHSTQTDTECGTTRCVAGWAIHFAADKKYQSLDDALRAMNRTPGLYENEAGDLLGLTRDEAYKLFQQSGNEQAVELCLRYATKGNDARDH